MPLTRIALLAALFAPGCYLSHERPNPATVDADGGGDDADAGAPGALLWVLVHPTTAPLGPGVFLFDESRQSIVRHHPLPPGRDESSVHGLAWDGTSIWVSSFFPPEILELDPETGAVRSTITGVAAEGIAAATDGTLWYAGQREGTGGVRVASVSRAGEELAALFPPEATVQDLALAGDTLFYLVNDDLDRIVRLTRSGARSELARVPHPAPYSLGFDGAYLAVAVDGSIHRFDPRTGALVRSGPLAVPGWITAIAFVR